MEILYLFLGWFLGIFSPLIVDGIRDGKRKKKLKQAMKGELKLLAGQMLIANYMIVCRLGNLNKDYLTWFFSKYEKYKLYVPDDVEIMEEFKVKMTSMGNDIIEQCASLLRNDFRKKGGIALKKYELPFIKSIVKELEEFSPDFNRKILGVLSSIEGINKDIEDAEFYLRKTFDPNIKSDNHEILVNNKETSYINLMTQSKILFNTVDSLIDNNL